MKREKLSERKLPDYTKGEEIFNMTTHIVGGGVGLVALCLCVIFAAIHKNTYAVVGSAIYGASMIVLYTMSSIYHGLKPGLKAKKSFSGYRPLLHIFAYSRHIYADLPCSTQRVFSGCRLDCFWCCLGCCRNRYYT